jgi:RNA polymerase sigma-70 factor (ECF subfamily)
MTGQPKSNEALVKRLLPSQNPDPTDRAVAWWEWYVNVGEASVLAFIRVKNDSPELDMDILQEAMSIAFAEVERGNYIPCNGIPFTAYVKGIARNKIREARRRAQRSALLEEAMESLSEKTHPHPETLVERRERWEMLQLGLAQLTRCRRQVLEAYLSGNSTPEIAVTLGMSEDLVRQHKSRGLRNLRRNGIWADKQVPVRPDVLTISPQGFG